LRRRKTRIVLKSGFIWKESGGELAAHNITQPKAVLPEELVNQSKGLVFMVGNERGGEKQKSFYSSIFLNKVKRKASMRERERESLATFGEKVLREGIKELIR
jgi:hypothetical protein